MPIVNGFWKSDQETGDEYKYSNHHPIEDLEGLCSGEDFDIVIIGGGGAGAAAAIEARDRGASVLILEKMLTPGGSTQESGGTIRLVTDRHGTIEHFWHLSQDATPHDVIEAFVDGLIEVPGWIAAHGGELVERKNEDASMTDEVGDLRRYIFPVDRPGASFPNLPFADSVGERGRMRPTKPGRLRGAALWDFLSRNLEELEVPVVLGARASRLVQKFPERSVIGVDVETPSGTVTVRARAGVILSCGGFAYDPEMMIQYYGVALPALSPPGRATGDGIRMAQDVGADLWHMSATATTVGYSVPELLAGFHCKITSYGFVMVDRYARRYVCETSMETHSFAAPMMTQDPLTGEYTRMPSFVILDDETRRHGILSFLGLGENRHYPWSPDNSVEIERGWISKADTLEELGRILEIPIETLGETIADYNAHVENGKTDSFGRTPDKMHRIATPPFYGAAIYPTLLNTQGGPRRNARCQVVRPDGTPIPGLYSAGELGSLWNRLYPGAGNVSEAVVTGRLAARSALESSKA
jgi:succinate dehydrogenase/fumarate reductase flavoprotein subunit